MPWVPDIHIRRVEGELERIEIEQREAIDPAPTGCLPIRHVEHRAEDPLRFAPGGFERGLGLPCRK